MAPTRSRGIQTQRLIMSSQLNSRYPKRGGTSPSLSKPVYEERTLKDQKIRLLKAPGVDSDVMWKQQSFEFAYNRLRAKLSDSCDADSLISIFNSHFPISTMPSEDLARAAVAKLHSAFGDISYLTPTAFLTRNGEDVTGLMYKKPRPANVCHLGVNAAIKMRDISHAFDDDMRFTVDYFLPLPQSFGESKLASMPPSSSEVSLKTPVLGSAEVLDKSVFSSPSKLSTELNLSSKVLSFDKDYFTPKKAPYVSVSGYEKVVSDKVQDPISELNDGGESPKQLYQDAE